MKENDNAVIGTRKQWQIPPPICALAKRFFTNFAGVMSIYSFIGLIEHCCRWIDCEKSKLAAVVVTRSSRNAPPSALHYGCQSSAHNWVGIRVQSSAYTCGVHYLSRTSTTEPLRALTRCDVLKRVLQSNTFGEIGSRPNYFQVTCLEHRISWYLDSRW